MTLPSMSMISPLALRTGPPSVFSICEQGEHGAGPVRNLTPHTRRGETEIMKW